MTVKESLIGLLSMKSPAISDRQPLASFLAFVFLTLHAISLWSSVEKSPQYSGFWLIIAFLNWLTASCLALYVPLGQEHTIAKFRNGAILTGTFLYFLFIFGKLQDDGELIGTWLDADYDSAIRKRQAGDVFFIFALLAISCGDGMTKVYVGMRDPRKIFQYQVGLFWFFMGLSCILSGDSRSYWEESGSPMMMIVAGVLFLLSSMVFQLYLKQDNPSYITYHVGLNLIGTFFYVVSIAIFYSDEERTDYEGRNAEIGSEVCFAFAMFSFSMYGLYFKIPLDQLPDLEQPQPDFSLQTANVQTQSSSAGYAPSRIPQNNVSPTYVPQTQGPPSYTPQTQQPNAPPAYNDTNMATPMNSGSTLPPSGVTSFNAPPAASSSSGGLADEIRKLNDLRNQGILSEDEFENAKAKLIARV